jgi:hypothetical protein
VKVTPSAFYFTRPTNVPLERWRDGLTTETLCSWRVEWVKWSGYEKAAPYSAQSWKVGRTQFAFYHCSGFLSMPEGIFVTAAVDKWEKVYYNNGDFTKKMLAEGYFPL